MTTPTLSERLIKLSRCLDEMRWYPDAAACREAVLELARLTSQLEAAGLAKPAPSGFLGEP